MSKKLVLVALMLAFCLVSSAHADITSDMLGYWALDGNANDSSGNGYHGEEFGNPSYVPGVINQAMDFDGPEQSVYIPDFTVIQNQDEVTVCMWVKADRNTGEDQVMWFTDQDGDYGRIRFGINGDEWEWKHGDGNGNPNVDDGENPIILGEWTHLAGTRKNNDKLELFVNGISVDQTDFGVTGVVEAQISIGAERRSSSSVRSPFDGVIDEVRVYSRVLSAADIQELFMFTDAPPIIAFNPNPFDEQTDVQQDAVLSWTAGEMAARHDVYFGTVFEDVNNTNTSDTTGIYRGRQNLVIYTPAQTLGFGQSYYWRIDEVEADNTTIIKGKVWSFTVAEFLSVDDFEDYNTGDNQIWWAWKDGIGYVAHDTEPAYPGNGTGSEIGDGSTDSFTEETIVHSGDQSMPYWYDNNKQGFMKYSEATKTLTNTRDWTEEGVKALSLWFRGYPASLGGFVEAPAGTYTISAEGADISGSSDQFHFAWQELSGAGEIIAKVESVENTNDWAKAGIIIRDTLEPDSVFAMVAVTPGNGVWFGRRTADGTDSDAQADITAPQWIKLDRSIGGLARASYSADGIIWTPLGTSVPVIMNTPMYIGLALTSNSSGVVCEAVFSNVTSNGTGPWVNQDIGLIKNEAEPMYVVIANKNGTTGTVYHEDPNATLMDTWTEWNIDLKDFQDQGVNLSDVNSITIGIGDKENPQPGGSGKMYFDDIALYRPRYVPDKVTLYKADFTGDSIVDFADLEIMVNDWLDGDYTVYATAPGPAMAQWEFENNVNDGIGGKHGTTRGNPTYAAGKSGQAINLDGDDYVDLGNPTELDFGIVDWSICAWVKTSMTGTDDSNKGVIYAKGADRADGIRYALYVNESRTVQGSITLVTDDDVDKRQAISSVSVSDGQWHHIVGQRNGDTINTYIDGVLDGTADLPADYNLSGTSQHNAYIGVVTNNETASPEKFLIGSVDDLRIYDYALSMSEIINVMGQSELYVPLTSPANISDEEPANSKTVNFRDFAILTDEWLQELIWPEW